MQRPVAQAGKDEFMVRWAVTFLCFVVVCVCPDRQGYICIALICYCDTDGRGK